MVIIHISGPPGSGKTTLGNYLRKNVKTKTTVVEDLDDLFNKFLAKNKFTVESYQKYIDKFISQNIAKHKNIIFVGLNMDMRRSNTFYNIQADYKYYIVIPIKINMERLFMRDMNSWLDWMKNRDHHILFKQLQKNEEEVVNGLTKSLRRVLSITNAEKDIKEFGKIYKKHKYIFLSVDTICKKVMKLVK